MCALLQCIRKPGPCLKKVTLQRKRPVRDLGSGKGQCRGGRDESGKGNNLTEGSTQVIVKPDEGTKGAEGTNRKYAPSRKFWFDIG